MHDRLAKARVNSVTLRGPKPGQFARQELRSCSLHPTTTWPMLLLPAWRNQSTHVERDGVAELEINTSSDKDLCTARQARCFHMRLLALRCMMRLLRRISIWPRASIAVHHTEAEPPSMERCGSAPTIVGSAAKSLNSSTSFRPRLSMPRSRNCDLARVLSADPRRTSTFTRATESTRSLSGQHGGPTPTSAVSRAVVSTSGRQSVIAAR
jgi:hypothetical protein